MGKDTGVPEGIPKSGRIWKPKQTQRFSAQQRTGFLKNQCKTFEEREEIRKRKLQVLELEREMKEERKRKMQEKKERREEQERRRKENEYKSSAFQVVRPYNDSVYCGSLFNLLIRPLLQIKAEKLKGMSKKQLRSIKKTSVNSKGVTELVSPWGEVKKKTKK